MKNQLPDELSSVFKYCEKTGKLYWKISNRQNKSGDEAGKLRKSRGKVYLLVGYAGARWRVHRIIWKLVHEVDPGDMEIDHINGNTLDNRIENLRLVTPSQNRCNSKLYEHNTSGFKGVSQDKRSGKWSAYINVRGKRINLGYWKTKEEAAEKVKQAREKYHKEFSNTGESLIA